ncbi:MAG: hypothetical protein QOK05_2821 [Chloroflexota bacterium]|nr:hypothetical protein [Chloroflexota bacterium]
MPPTRVDLRVAVGSLVGRIGVHRLFVGLLGAWTALNLAAAAYLYWSVQHSVVCVDQDGSGPFCRYHLMTSAISAAAGPLKVFVIGMVMLDVAWLITVIRSEG